MYDYLIVGSGLFGSVFSYFARLKGKSCIFIEQRDHIAGNLYTEKMAGIEVHKYGAHIFRTSDVRVWQFINQFDTFNNFINSPIANYRGQLFNLPFNMNTFYQMWKVGRPKDAEKIIEQQRQEIKGKPINLEEQAISLVGRDLYEILIKGYTEKQWGRSCKELPASILRRLPVRYTFDNNYFNARYQGIPENGYTAIIKKMIGSCPIILKTNFNNERQDCKKLAKRIIYTGTIDSYFDYCYGPLEYRSLRFEHNVLDQKNFQGVAVMNFTDPEVPYTRIIEHKHFTFGDQKQTVITYEYPLEWRLGLEPYYPINDKLNQIRYEKYCRLAIKEKNVHFGGRLGEYKYYDMQDTILSAMQLANRLL